MNNLLMRSFEWVILKLILAEMIPSLWDLIEVLRAIIQSLTLEEKNYFLQQEKEEYFVQTQ